MDDNNSNVRLRQLDNRISSFESVLSSLALSHPQRVSCIQELAIAKLKRYVLSGQQDDLEQFRLHSTRAILLQRPWTRCPLSIVEAFYYITITLPRRTLELKDVKWCIRSLRYLRDQPLETFHHPLNMIVKALVCHLGRQIELKPGDIIRDIEEMAVLCHELVKSDILRTSLIDPVMALAGAIRTYYSRGLAKRSVLPEKVMEFLREANRCLPDCFPVSITLADTLLKHFLLTPSNDDYKEGTAVLDRIIALPSLAEDRGIQRHALVLTATFAAYQWLYSGKPESLEKEICRFRTFLSESSPEDPVDHVIEKQLARLRGLRKADFGLAGSPQDVHSTGTHTDFPDVPSFRELSASLLKSTDDELPSIVLGDQHYRALAIDISNIDLADIGEAIKYYRIVVTSYPPSSPYTLVTSFLFGDLLYQAFQRTNKIEYLNEAISFIQDHLTSRAVSISFLYMPVVRRLFVCLYTRFELLHYKEDIDEMMQLLSAAVNNKHANIQDRFRLSCDWGLLARQCGYPYTLTVYECAFSLMQDILTFAPTLDTQHFRLVSLLDHEKELPLDYASYLVHISRLHQAIETLEQGRTLLWSQMRGLRTSVNQIRAADAYLADKFAAVNKDLEMVALNASSNSNNDHGGDGLEGSDRVGLLLLQQRKLLDVRDKLLSQICALPGFESFLKTPSFDTLSSAALRGPVIIINHSEWRSDILILLHNSPPSLITTTNDFYERVIGLRDRLVECRNSKDHGLDSNQYQRVLRTVLMGLYDLIGGSIIERLRILNVPEQSRVWFCPTSVLCSLPLHAMGPIPSRRGLKRYFSDLYIPSYTPTLSALLESRKYNKQIFEKPSILLVAQPDLSLLNAWPEIWTIRQLDTKVTTLMSSKATPANVVEGLREHRFLHLVCHGKLEHGRPFDASFQLHDGKRLTLLELMQSQLPFAEFAFLSACHTAEMTEGSLADEALHLTAVMQYCGFRSVVGTMWGMADADGPELVKHFYKSMFSDKESGTRTPYYERSAKALRDAVQQLRKPGLPLERWVNFVHYGA